VAAASSFVSAFASRTSWTRSFCRAARVSFTSLTSAASLDAMSVMRSMRVMRSSQLADPRMNSTTPTPPPWRYSESARSPRVFSEVASFLVAFLMRESVSLMRYWVSSSVSTAFS